MKKNPIKKIKIDINKNLIIFNIIEFFLITCVVVLFYVNLFVYSTKVIYIPKGSTNSIITYLSKSGYELNFIDKTLVRFLGYPQQGWIDLKAQKMTKADFLYKLVTSKAALKEVTLIPGETYYFFLKDVALKMGLSEIKLFNAYRKYAFREDGNILAESYSLPMGMSEENLIYYLISYTQRRYEEFSKKIFGEYTPQNWYYYISIASVIQKEAASKEEMPLVSSVVYNRLNKGMPLQMDGTLNYGRYSHERVTAARIREDDSYYNTYLNKGIPQHPVCAISLDAIKAAIFPAKTEYLYFVKDNRTSMHRFSTNYKDHVNNINNNPKVAAPIIKEIKAVSSTIAPNVNVSNKPVQTKVTINNKEAKENKNVETSIFDTIKKDQKPAIIKDLWKNVK
ncbi:MAG: endolytic transglycosylase MltG [Arcobacteraceae bacterium]